MKILTKNNRLVTAKLQKKMKKRPHFDYFPRPGETDPYAHHPHEPHGSATAWPTLIESTALRSIKTTSIFKLEQPEIKVV